MSDFSSIVPGLPGIPGGPNGYGQASSIHRNGAASYAAPVNPVESSPATDPNNRISSYQPGEDRVEVSDFARYLEQLRRLPEVRLDRVAAARQAIAEGAYDDEGVLDATIERMSEEEGL